MKFCFLVNGAPFLTEFLGKIAYETVQKGDECLVIFSSKFAEYEGKRYFPKEAKFISKVDWSLKYYDSSKREFGDISWQEFHPAFNRMDRHSFKFEEIFNWVLQEYQFFEYVFKKENPDIIIFEPPAGLFSKVAYYFSRRYRVPYLSIINSRFGNNKLDVYNLEWSSSKYEEIFRQLKDTDILDKERGVIKVFIKEFIKHDRPSLDVELSKVFFSPFGLFIHYVKRIKEKGGILFRYWYNKSHFKGHDFESEVIFRYSLRTPWNAQKRQIRIFLQKHLYRTFNKEDKFFIFPLHLQPESTTAAFASYYADQFLSIRNIAFSLPFPFKLYVKEHPHAIGTKSMKFYQELKRIPNVVLISPDEDVFLLIKQSFGVITLTGTIGIEAAFAGKPVYIFGDVFYSYHPMCRNVNSFADLKDKIQIDIKEGNKISDSDLENINIRFVASYTKNSIPGNLSSDISENDKNDYKIIHRNLKNIAKDAKE